jgi:enhancer of mRNA-decapping protein 3
MIADGAVPSPLSISQGDLGRRPAVKQSSVSSIATTLPQPIAPKPRGRRDSQATAVLTEPFDALAVGDEVDSKKKEKKSKHKSNHSQTGPGIIDLKDINGPLQPTNTKPPKKQGKGKGWRQTPLIEEIPAASKHARRQRGRKQDDANGWATEDATDIQDMGDFDFVTNLSKFNKRQVFDDIRKDDTTADDERLVSFNRKAKPGTNGGKNLHWTENVLDSPQVHEPWNSEAGETENDGREEHYSSGLGSKRAGSKRPLQSRKGSMLPSQIERTASPRPYANVVKGGVSPINGSVSGLRASFRLESNKPCHCISPLQMVEIEQLCYTELGLTEDMLSENAGRSIAETVLKSFSTTEVRHVVVLAGNHKSGARAIAAARHLRNRRLRVTVVVMGGEREEMMLEVVRKQLSIYKKGQGYVDRWDEFQSKTAAGGPQPDVIIDAILGVHVTFDELRTDDQATAFEMIRWASRFSDILSVDVPSGLSATSGLITEAEGQLLVMNSRTVVALGAPKLGLLHAMAMDGAEASWKVLVADIGISTAVWQKHGSRRKHGIDFGNEWLVPVKFVGG